MILAIVLMILAAVVFALQTFGVDVGSVHMLALGLLLEAAAFIAAWVPTRRVP